MNDPPFPMLTRFVNTLDRVLPGFRFMTLWIFFALLMAIFPFVTGRFGSIIFTILFSVLIISSVLTTSGRRDVRAIAIILMAMTIITRWGFFLTEESTLNAISFLFATVTLALVSLLLFLALFKIQEVSSATIWQAISVYLLLGIAWACFFAFLEALQPGSFRDSVYPNTTMTFQTLMYYSFVTLATLGYGDILPTTQQARGLVIIEVLMGVLYMAILISRLVGTWHPGEEKKS